MSNGGGPSIEELYEAFMDIGEFGGDYATSFGQDVFNFFGGVEGISSSDWASEYGMYLPIFDPTGIDLAKRESDLSFNKARDVLKLSNRAADRVFETEKDTIRTGLDKDLSKGREVQSRTGLRSGAVESAIEDTAMVAANKVKDLGDRYTLQQDENQNKYEAKIVESTLDFDKAEYQEKEEFYDRTMAAIQRLIDKGAFDPREGDDENLGTLVPGEQEELIATGISNCIQSGNSQEWCQEYIGTSTEFALEFGYGSVDETAIDLLDTGVGKDFARKVCESNPGIRVYCNAKCIGSSGLLGVSGECLDNCFDDEC